MRTVLADDLVCKLASKVILDGLLLGSSLNGCLESVQEHCKVLLDIHLLEHVHWLAFPVLEGVTVTFWVYVHLLREEQSGEQCLELHEHVVFVSIFVVVRVRHGKNVVSEAWDHEQLLVQRVHVADAAEVLDANMARDRLLIFVKFDVPVVFFVCPPTWLLVESLHVV